MHVIIDHREQSLKEYFNSQHVQTSFPIAYENLEYADVNIYINGDLFLVIERKTLADLAASIKDGRYKKQKLNLLSKLRREQILYLIEGPFDYTDTSAVSMGGISKKILLSSMINTLIRDNIKVLTTKDVNDTIQCILSICSRIHEDPGKYLSNHVAEPQPPPQKMNKTDKIDKKTCFFNQLCQVPGVSAKTADAITKKYDSLYSFIKYLESDDTFPSKCKLLKEIKLESDKGKLRHISSTVVENLVYYFTDHNDSNDRSPSNPV